MSHLPSIALILVLASSLAGAQNSPDSPSLATIPSGTSLPLVIVRPIWAESAKPGDPIYAQTTFPVTTGGVVAVPSGSYVQGQIDSIVRPTRRSNHATMTIHLTRIILANGYAIPLPESLAQITAQIQTTRANDLLLDNGAQLEVALSSPLSFDTTKATSAVALTEPVTPGHFISATLCRPTPATPGSPDTVIPGTPGTPGTPDTIIPGAFGAPDTVIPGIPATPGTPSTIIPGFSGSSGRPCPASPLILSSAPSNQTAQNLTKHP